MTDWLILNAWWFLPLYFLPTLIMVYKRGRNTSFMFGFNLIFGLSGIGWLVCVVIAWSE